MRERTHDSPQVDPAFRTAGPTDPCPGWPSLLIVLAAVLLAVPVPARAQDRPPPSAVDGRHPSAVLTAHDLAASASVTLPGGWRFHLGDDPGYAAPDLDDSGWMETDTWLSQDQLPAGWSGMAWFRLHLRVEEGVVGKALAFRVTQFGTFEVYLEGRHLFGAGKIGGRDETWKPRLQTADFVHTFVRPGDHILALRLSNPDVNGDNQGRVGFTMEVGDINLRLPTALDTHVLLGRAQGLFSGVLVAVGLLHLLLFAFSPDLKDNLFFSLLSLTGAALAFFFLERWLTESAVFLLWFDRIMNVTASLFTLFALSFVYGTFYEKSPKWRWGALGAGLSLLIWGALDSQVSVWIFAFILLVSAEMVRVVMVALWKRKVGARIVGAGVVVLAAGFGWGVLINLEMAPGSPLQVFFIAFGSLLFLIATMSIYLSWRYALTNLELKKQLKQVEELTEGRIRDELKRQALENENHRRGEELEEARKLQLSMLPDPLPHVPGAELAVHMQTATEVGGDYYDFHLTGDGELTMAVGDATGHGMRAGTLVTATKSIFNALAYEDDLLQILKRASWAIKEMKLPRLAMAFTLARYRSDGSLRLVSAGMPSALICRTGHGAVETIPAEGAPLGTLMGFPYRQHRTVLGPGDAVVFVSDGLPELQSSEGELFGYERLRDLLAHDGASSARQVIDHLVSAATDWSHGHPPDDDMTFVVLRRFSHS